MEPNGFNPFHELAREIDERLADPRFYDSLNENIEIRRHSRVVTVLKDDIAQKNEQIENLTTRLEEKDERIKELTVQMEKDTDEWASMENITRLDLLHENQNLKHEAALLERNIKNNEESLVELETLKADLKNKDEQIRRLEALNLQLVTQSHKSDRIHKEKDEKCQRKRDQILKLETDLDRITDMLRDLLVRQTTHLFKLQSSSFPRKCRPQAQRSQSVEFIPILKKSRKELLHPRRRYFSPAKSSGEEKEYDTESSSEESE